MMKLSHKTVAGCLAAAAMSLAGMSATQVQADVITLANNTTVQGRINGNDFSQPGTISEGRTIRAGTTAGNAEFRGYMLFDTSSFLDPVASAILSYETATPAGSPGSYEVYGVSVAAGFDTAINTVGERTALFQAPGTVNATLLSTEASAVGVVNIDVTAFLNAERGNGNNVVAFVFAEVAPSLNGVLDLIQIYDSNDPGVQNPQLELTAVPEPTSLALMGLGALAMVRRRRAM